MWWYPLLSLLPAAQVHAFVAAPLDSHPTKLFALVPVGLQHKALMVNRAVLPPAPLTITARTDTWSSDATPYFTARQDRTLAWSARNLCLDASAIGDDHTVRMNHCTSEPTQLWNVLSSGPEGSRQIQLKGTTKCIGVRLEDSDSHQASVELRECDDVLAQSWKFVEPILRPTQNLAQPPASVHAVGCVTVVMVSIGVLSLSWLRLRRRTARIVMNKCSGIVEQGGVCLSSPFFRRSGGSGLIPVPAVFEFNPLPGTDDRPTSKKIVLPLHPKWVSQNPRIASTRMSAHPDENYTPDPESVDLQAQDSLTWDKERFDPEQNTLFLDIDDTVVSSGSSILSGVDSEDNQARRMIPADDIKSKHEVYSGVLSFMNFLSSGTIHNKSQVAATGNLFVTSARPEIVGGKVVTLFHEKLQQHTPDRLYRDPVGILWGSKRLVSSLVWTLTFMRLLEKLNLKASSQKREKLKRKYESIGEFKVRGIKQQVHDIQESFPQYRQSLSADSSHETHQAQSGPGLIFFLGDNGQGDFFAGMKLLQEKVVDYVFIHDVRNLRSVPAADWIDHDPEAAGVELYQACPQEVRDRMILFRDYREAVELSNLLLFVGPDGVVRE